MVHFASVKKTKQVLDVLNFDHCSYQQFYSVILCIFMKDFKSWSKCLEKVWNKLPQIN